MYVIGLTGGIACGKSTVSAALRKEGAAIVDADAIAHALSRPGGAVYDFYVQKFGAEILAADGTLDRPAIARRVFADPDVRDAVNARVHPLIRAAAMDEIADARAAGHAAVVLDVPLLFEAGWHRLADESWVVSVPENVQLARLMERDATMSEEEARCRFGIGADDVPILLMPGSRREEIERLLPPMLGAAELLAERNAARRFFLPVAGGVDEERIRAHLAASSVEVMLTHDARYALMGIARAAIAASGTVIMEAAIMGLPAVVLYRMSALSYLVGRLLVDVPRFSLPNILVGETFETELLQDAVQPERIAEAMERIIADGTERDYVTERLARAVALLGEPHAARRVAEKILALGKHA